MKRYLLDKLACPRCNRFPLVLRSDKERAYTAEVAIARPCDLYCAFKAERLHDLAAEPPCAQCLTQRVVTGELICPECEAHYPIRDGIPNLLVDEQVSNWVSAEQDWWERRYAKILNERRLSELRKANSKGDIAGNRFFERKKYLFEPLHRRGMRGKLVVEVGVGMAETVVNLLPPAEEQYLYIGTDVAREALLIASRLLPEADFIQCAAGNMPLRRQIFDYVFCLGVLHHIPDWQANFERILDLLKPGGWMVLNEAIAKPRILSRFRSQSLTAAVDSPHEGKVTFEELVTIAKRKGRLVLVRVQTTPLRIALVWMTERRMDRSSRVTHAILIADQIFRRTVGRLFKSLGPGEMLGIIERRMSHER